mgnify:CR=1 FL=1
MTVETPLYSSEVRVALEGVTPPPDLTWIIIAFGLIAILMLGGKRETKKKEKGK